MKKILLWTAIALAVLLILAAISMPNLLRSRVAFDKAMKQSVVSLVDPGESESLGLRQPTSSDYKKIIHNAGLSLVVSNVRDAAQQIQKVVEAGHGEVSQMQMSETGSGYRSATVTVRVPAASLNDIVSQLKKLALRTEKEELTSRDVTREFYDNEAHMRNLHAEEEQYLSIMKQAHTVKDTLEVSEKLSDVRDRIERLQAEILVMTHDIDMSEVKIELSQEVDASVFGWHWRPLNNAKLAASDLLEGAGDWFDWVVALLIKLPLIILWTLTVGLIVWVIWKIGRWTWRRLKPSPAAQG